MKQRKRTANSHKGRCCLSLSPDKSRLVTITQPHKNSWAAVHVGPAVLFFSLGTLIAIEHRSKVYVRGDVRLSTRQLRSLGAWRSPSKHETVNLMQFMLKFEEALSDGLQQISKEVYAHV